MTFKAHFYSSTQDNDQVFVYSVNSNLFVLRMCIWRTLLGEEVTMLVYPQRLTTSNLNMRHVVPVSCPFTSCSVSSDISTSVYSLFPVTLEWIYYTTTARGWGWGCVATIAPRSISLPALPTAVPSGTVTSNSNKTDTSHKCKDTISASTPPIPQMRLQDTHSIVYSHSSWMVLVHSTSESPHACSLHCPPLICSWPSRAHPPAKLNIFNKEYSPPTFNTAEYGLVYKWTIYLMGGGEPVWD